MSGVAISKHFKAGRHVGFKKFVYGRNFHLVTGTTAAHERQGKDDGICSFKHHVTFRGGEGLHMASVISALAKEGISAPLEPALATASKLLTSIVEEKSYVGEVYSLGYQDALVQIHDYHRRQVGGIPALSFLSSTGSRIVASIPFLTDAEDTLATDDVALYPQFGSACALLDKLASNRYPNAVTPLVSAHAEAAIPLELGQKVLQQLAKALMRHN